MARRYNVDPAELTVRATTSNAINFLLKSGTAGIDLSGATVEMFLKDNAGGTTGFTTVGASPKLGTANAAGGTISFTPGTADLVAGSAPYVGYFKVHATASTHYYVPESAEFTLNVRETF